MALAGGEPARALVVSLLEQGAVAEREIARLAERIGRLEEQERSDSRNSSKPPSSDPPKTRAERRAAAREKAKQRAKAEREGSEPRNAGGQPGHRGSGRRLAPEDEVDVVENHYPDACGGCGHEFTKAERTAGRFGRHQIAELPPIAVVVIEHRTHKLRCPCCKTSTAAELPAEPRGSAFGACLQAAVVTMTARNRVSRRDMSELSGELFGVALSVGTVDAICRRAAGALAGPHERLVAAVLEAPAVNLDETGWATAVEGRTLWTATTPTAAIFRIAEDRHRDRLDELIGTDFGGIACSDRWWAYDHIDPERRQACWEHLKRDWRRHAEGLAEQKAFGDAGLALTRRLFAAWRAFDQHGDRDRDRFKREMAPIQAQLRKLLEHGARKSQRTRRHRRFANNLLKIWPALFTFVEVEGVSPTNNAAERSLRGPVIHRKLSHGTRTSEGERFVERALSASVTCRLQGRSLFAYLADLIGAHARSDPLPALT